MSDNPQILSIDDDKIFSDNIKVYFARRGVSVASITDSSIASAIDFQRFKVVLLDLEMPNVSGLDIVKNLSKEARPVVIVVSGHSDIDKRLEVLEHGADFFLPKPVDLRELFSIAKRALLRADSAVDQEVKWVLDRSKLALTTPEGSTFGLSGSEFRVLEKLMRCAPQAVPKEDLAWAASGHVNALGANYIRSLEVMISRMRTRFNTETISFPGKSLRSQGYIFYGDRVLKD